ncbi:DUF2087 domain-containing protein [Afifella sp. JA880]|uniref:DUF2087 domain-containing protein n=1 Tax=Afifella sp. JA880 TaxID=2975280 RepID=UPI0021BB6CC4|nr:DUF2087 domain-containing protein [Afifella sp. JA880]MCT8266547.1 DUF2087 domain-containing protein [Afifella sp. JA880]
MSRTPIPLATRDMSTFAKSLRRQLADHEAPPSHLELLNMLARSAGHRNFQQLRANMLGEELPGEQVASGDPSADHLEIDRAADNPPADERRLKRVLRQFDQNAVLVRWPKRKSDRELCLWLIWSLLPAGETFTEVEVNAFLVARHSFGDPVLLRRALVDLGLVWRTRSGSEYRRVELEPPSEALALIRRLGVRPEPARSAR